MGPNKNEIDQAIKDLKSVKLNVEDCGDIEDYVGVYIQRSSEGLHLHQPLLIESILDDVGINLRQAEKAVPVASTKILHRNLLMCQNQVRGHEDTHALKIVKNLYWQRQAGRVWNQFLEEKLGQIEFLPSNPCVYYKGQTIFAVYGDNGIFMGPNKNEIDQAIKDLKSVMSS